VTLVNEIKCSVSYGQTIRRFDKRVLCRLVGLAKDILKNRGFPIYYILQIIHNNVPIRWTIGVST